MPYDGTRLDALLVERGVIVRPDGQRVWRLKHGDVEVGEVREGGQLIATEVRVPLSDKTELVREVVEETAALAAQAGARLVDPQLGRALTANDSGAVADQFLRTARYAGEMMGVSEAVSASYAAPPEGMSAGTKVVLAIVGGLILLYFLVNSLTERLGH
jgi:hypothetical protein